MQQRLNLALTRTRDTFAAFTAGQKAVAVVGTAALLLAAFLVFRWVSAPTYAPLYSNLSGEDASAIVDELDAEGVSYELADGGSTVMVPRNDVYASRVKLQGKGLPGNSGTGGYEVLKDQGLSTSESQENTNFKRAMEGEVAKTLEAMDGVNTAIVHLAMPEAKVFSDEQEPTTASVLIDTTPGAELDDEQVQSMVSLVARSIDGLDPKNVTISDAAGKLLTADSADGTTGAASTRAKQVEAFQNSMRDKIKTALDTWVGPGNSTTTVTADLDFDKSTTDSRSYSNEKKNPPKSQTKTSEKYSGTNPNSQAGGVVGPDGQMDPTAGANGDGTYENNSETRDNALDEVVERRESAPGGVKSLHIAVTLDATAAADIQPEVVKDQIASAAGIDPQRGDTIEVAVLPFDKSVAEANAAEIAAAKAAEAADRKNALIRNGAIGGGVLLLVLIGWWQARRRAKARDQATSYVVEQLRLDAANRAPVLESPALAALDAAEDDESDSMREDLIALVERQPDDVAALLRGWLVEPRK
ncbi:MULTISPECIES: flagellar basal-body MS-ring/collar protein FliF [unclassified Nocardioides]|uniref:flagellar basal-body MS-ring/collar protein FliF n=1 Tax=unclassified Nocardioides TaxID=2615069 RepID=UPI00070334E9|nr:MULTISPECIES: flagellar basal-body MS-ring/collar protein FliF [unclassified Nocardioides]KRC52616.1 flagellar M-ring protein FliF [Nocardioides sp. Root79]KRC72148.1 flagellar M-ring protein FliF [Nocardioides sp. Root240]